MIGIDQIIAFPIGPLAHDRPEFDLVVQVVPLVRPPAGFVRLDVVLLDLEGDVFLQPVQLDPVPAQPFRHLGIGLGEQVGEGLLNGQGGSIVIEIGDLPGERPAPVVVQPVLSRDLAGSVGRFITFEKKRIGFFPIELPVQVESRLPADSFAGFRPDPSDLVGVAGNNLYQFVHQVIGTPNAVPIGLQHMGLRGKTDTLVQGCITRGIARQIEEAIDALVGCAVDVDIGRHFPTSFRHSLVEVGQQAVVEIPGQGRGQLDRMAGDQRHGILVIRAIGRVVVDENIGLPFLKDLIERSGIAGITLDEIPVEVEVPGVSAKTVLYRAFLIGPAERAAIQPAADIVKGNGDHYHFLQGFAASRIEQVVLQQHHGGIDPAGLTRMDGVVDEQEALTLLSQGNRVEIAVDGKDGKMERKSGIGVAIRPHGQGLVQAIQLLVKPDHLRIRGAGSIVLQKGHVHPDRILSG